jgi:hypothetical protein
MRTRNRFALAVVALSLSLVPFRAVRAGGTVDGELTLEGRRVALAHALALEETGHAEPTYVVLATEKDPGEGVGVAPSALFGDYGAALYLRVTAAGRVVDVKLWHPAAKGGEFLEAPSDALVVEHLRVVDGAVEVKLATPEPRTTAGQSWTLTLDARAPILR